VLATAIILALLAPTAALAVPATDIAFDVIIDPAIRDTPYSGRIYVALSAAKDVFVEIHDPDSGQSDVALPASEPREPRLTMHSWFNPPPVFSKDVQDVSPGDVIAMGENLLAHPMPLAELPAGAWDVQAIARVNPDSPTAGTGAGDLVSEPMTIFVTDDEPARIRLTISRAIEPRAFPKSDRVKLFEMVSPLLSAFLGRERTISAGVILPPEYDAEAERAAGESRPVIVWIGGFGDTHFSAIRLQRFGPATSDDAKEAIWVVPDPSCYRGHSVFADSANNGPWGEALVNEMLPAIDAKFNGAGPSERYVTGISSGGWSSLWLQVTYPEAFAGCWSHVPDPVDFRDFQQANLYAPGMNIYTDSAGGPRPLARRNGEVMLQYKDFVARETVMGPGGQIHSFEAVFSPPSEDGTPHLMFDRATGEVDTPVAETWKAYDIAEILRTNWQTLGPRLQGKLHIYAGGEDTFYLEGAVELLQADMTTLSDDPVIEVIEGMPHALHGPGVTDMLETMKRRRPVTAEE
jgi:hypothetical protein